MKKLYSLIVCLALIFTLTACNSSNDSDASKFKSTYEALNDESPVHIDVPEENPMKFATIDEVLDLVKSGSGVIYFGFPECPWCRNAVPVLIQAAKDNNLDTIYYFNPSDYRDSNDSKFQELMGLLDPYLTETDDGSKRLFVPDVFFVKDGKIQSNHLGTVASQTDPTHVLNDDQRKELTDIYTKGIESTR